MRKLGEELRAELRKPFGELLDEKKVAERVRKRKGLLISVGDVCSFNLLKNGVSPDIVIYDLKYMRKDVDQEVKYVLDNFRGPLSIVKSPAGVITDELVDVVENAIECRHGKIFVNGEEDLSALVAMMLAPEGSVIVYGQPNEGAVFVELNDGIRERANGIFSRMEEVRK